MGPTHCRLGPPSSPSLTPANREAEQPPAQGSPQPSGLGSHSYSGPGVSGRRLSDTRPWDRLGVGWARTSSSPRFLCPLAATALGHGYWQLDLVWVALFTHLLSPGH